LALALTLAVPARAAGAPPAAAPPATSPAAAAPAAAAPAEAPAATPPPAAAPAAPPPSDADERTAKNAIYIEGLGAGLFYSLNYERSFSDFSARLGFSYISLGATASTGTSGVSASATWIAFPLMVNYLGIRAKKHIFDLGAGVSVLMVGAGASSFGQDGSASASASTVIPAPVLNIGYRIQPTDGGFVFKIGWSPMLINGYFWPTGYLALGAAF
jgi:hypothetical protein